jgi:predicted lipoprotein
MMSFMLALSPMAQAADLVQAIHESWSAPRAAEFARQSVRLAPAVQSLCDSPPERANAALDQARREWLESLGAWERLSAVAIGPVLERRSQRQIDFTPTRPRLIEKAVKAAPADAAAMELIGTPAKGLPALEWLLWVKPAQPASPECRYAVQVAAEIGREAQALASTHAAPADAKTALADLVNQWVGGLERLRWANLEMPARVAQTGARETPDFSRRASGASALAWAAQWEALRGLAIGTAALESALRERGQPKTADTLVQAVRAADADMRDLAAHDTPRILAAAKTLAALKRLVENEVAPALGVSIGFSDADGD